MAVGLDVGRPGIVLAVSPRTFDFTFNFSANACHVFEVCDVCGELEISLESRYLKLHSQAP